VKASLVFNDRKCGKPKVKKGDGKEGLLNISAIPENGITRN